MLPKAGVSGNAGHICVPSVVRFSVSNHLIYFITKQTTKKIRSERGGRGGQGIQGIGIF